MTRVELKLDGPVARMQFGTENGIHILDAACRRQLADALDQIEQRPDVRIVVFESTGRTFLAGADIRELQALTPISAVAYARSGQRLFQRVAQLRPVTIAAIHAACAGGGCELALACDLRMAAAEARIGLPETSLGLVPGWGGTVRAMRVLGPAVARRFILTAELLPAEECLRLGLFDSVTAADKSPAEVERRVKRLLQSGPLALRDARLLMDWLAGGDIEQELAAEAETFARCYISGEPAVGTAAFLAKRRANWTGD